MLDANKDVFKDNLGHRPQEEVAREVSEQPDITENAGTTEDVGGDLLSQRDQARLDSLNRSP